MKTEVFSTESMPPQSSAVRGWQEANRRLNALNFKIAPRGNAFQARIRVCSSRRLRFSTLNVSSHVGTLGGISRRDIDPFYQIAYVTEGSVIVGQDGRETCVSAGDFVVVDTARPFRLDTLSLQAHSVDIPAARMREIFPQVDGLTSVCILGRSGPGLVLRSTLETVITHGPELGDDASDHIADAIPHLTAGLLATLPAARDVVPSRMDSFHRQRVRNFIHSNLGDRELSPEMIARSLDLSLRYLHKLWEGETATLMRGIWAARIGRCGDDLAKPELRSRTIGEIAYAWGFNDQAHFSRLFRSQMGRSPKAYREERSA